MNNRYSHKKQYVVSKRSEMRCNWYQTCYYIFDVARIYIRNIEIGASNLTQPIQSIHSSYSSFFLLTIDMNNNLLESNIWVDEYASSSDQVSHNPHPSSNLSHDAQDDDNNNLKMTDNKKKQDYQQIWEKRKQGQNHHKRIDTELSASSVAAISSNSFLSKDQVITTMKIKLTEAEYQQLMARKKLYDASKKDITSADDNDAKGSHR